MISPWERFQALKPISNSDATTAVPCGLHGAHLLIRGDRGEPTLLLSTEPRTSPRADIRLKYVGVQFDRRFEIAHSEQGGMEVGNFCKVNCHPSSTQLHQHFVELMVATASAHPGVLSAKKSDEIVDVLLEIFRKNSLPADQAVTGLWGELLLVYLATSPGRFIDAWHLRATDGFDFAFADKRIEVKTTERLSREHEFSLKQVRSGRDTDLIASITLARSSAGLTALDLARLIAQRLEASQQAKLWRLVLETLGPDADADDEQRFDVKGASDALILVRACDVPAPTVALSDADFVSDVRFRSNINALCSTSFVARAEILD